MKKSLLRDYKNNGKLELGLRQCILGSLNSFIDELVINNKILNHLFTELFFGGEKGNQVNGSFIADRVGIRMGLTCRGYVTFMP